MTPNSTGLSLSRCAFVGRSNDLNIPTSEYRTCQGPQDLFIPPASSGLMMQTQSGAPRPIPGKIKTVQGVMDFFKQHPWVIAWSKVNTLSWESIVEGLNSADPERGVRTFLILCRGEAEIEIESFWSTMRSFYVIGNQQRDLKKCVEDICRYKKVNIICKLFEKLLFTYFSHESAAVNPGLYNMTKEDVAVIKQHLKDLGINEVETWGDWFDRYPLGIKGIILILAKRSFPSYFGFTAPAHQGAAPVWQGLHEAVRKGYTMIPLLSDPEDYKRFLSGARMSPASPQENFFVYPTEIQVGVNSYDLSCKMEAPIPEIWNAQIERVIQELPQVTSVCLTFIFPSNLSTDTESTMRAHYINQLVQKLRESHPETTKVRLVVKLSREEGSAVFFRLESVRDHTLRT